MTRFAQRARAGSRPPAGGDGSRASARSGRASPRVLDILLLVLCPVKKRRRGAPDRRRPAAPLRRRSQRPSTLRPLLWTRSRCARTSNDSCIIASISPAYSCRDRYAASETGRALCHAARHRRRQDHRDADHARGEGDGETRQPRGARKDTRYAGCSSTRSSTGTAEAKAGARAQCAPRLMTIVAGRFQSDDAQCLEHDLPARSCARPSACRGISGIVAHR